MKNNHNNLFNISKIVDYIEDHLDESLDLESLANEVGYSKYHLHRMFTSIVGLTLHSYVQRRRLTEAARLLIFTNQTIMEIGLFAGYATQQSFSVAFKAMFDCNPQKYRKKGEHYPLQLKFTINGKNQLRGDRIMDIKTIESEEILLVGYTGNTKKGFSVIGKCMRKLEANLENINNRTDKNCLIAVNDYSKDFSYDKEGQPSFDFYGVVEVTDFSVVPKGMVRLVLAATKYVVFSFNGNPKDSLQPVADYIYQEWFPKSTCQFNESNMYDFTKSYEPCDKDSNCLIEYWIPIL